MTTAYNPFREMDRLFDQVSRAAATNARTMPMDLYRDGDRFVVKMDLPGVAAESIDIDVDDRILTVRAERAQDEVKSTDEGSGYLSRERSYGSFARQLTLGAGLDLANIAADYTDGVLTLVVPVAEEAKPRKIKVSSGLQSIESHDVTGQIEQGSSDQKPEEN